VTLKERADLHDREIAAIRKLIFTGMKMINRNQQQITELRAIQKVTELKLQEFIDSMRGGGNGHSKRPLR
jgi:hypothetical protein